MTSIENLIGLCEPVINGFDLGIEVNGDLINV